MELLEGLAIIGFGVTAIATRHYTARGTASAGLATERTMVATAWVGGLMAVTAGLLRLLGLSGFFFG